MMKTRTRPISAWILSACLLLALVMCACSRSHPENAQAVKGSSAEATRPALGSSLEPAPKSSNSTSGGGAEVGRFSLRLDPAQPVTGDRVRAVVTAQGLEDGEYDITIRWNVNGVDLEKTGEVLDHPLAYGDAVTVTAELSAPGKAPRTMTSTVLVGNAAPTIAVSAASVGQGQYSAEVRVEDPEQDVAQVSLVEAPEGMTLDPGAGVLRWHPESFPPGVHHVALEAVDSAGNRCRYAFDVTITEQEQNLVAAEVPQQ